MYNENNTPLTSTNVTDKSLYVLKFDDIYKYFLLKFLHFVFYERFDLFIIHFKDLLPSQNYDTRNNRINLPYVRTDVEKSFT